MSFDVWNNPSYHESPLKKILVIAIRRNPVQRRILEDVFVGDLSKYGVEATPSYHLFPNALPDTNQVISSIKENNFDGILVTRHLLSKMEIYYIEGCLTNEQSIKNNDFRQRYETYYHEVEHRGYLYSLIVKRRSIDVWVIKYDYRIIWSAASNSPEMNTVESIQSYIAN